MHCLYVRRLVCYLWSKSLLCIVAIAEIKLHISIGILRSMKAFGHFSVPHNSVIIPDMFLPDGRFPHNFGVLPKSVNYVDLYLIYV